MKTTTNTIRPGLLVALRSSLSGGVTYVRVDKATEAAPEGADVSTWETTRTIADRDEHARASQARSKATAEIRKVCSLTSFGLLCPESLEPELDAAIARARAIAAAHNATAEHTKVSVLAFKGRIASSDEAAARAIGREVSDLIDGMNSAIDRLDVEAIRTAANKARELSSMLSPELSATVGEAVETARRAARQIVKRVEKGAEQAAVVLADIQRGGIQKARIAFLDLTDEAPAAAQEPALPTVDVQRFAGLDVGDEADSADEVPVVALPAVPARPALDLGSEEAA